MKFTLEVEKADDGGYQGRFSCGELTRTVCKTTLHELIGWSAEHAGAACKESPYLPLQPQPYRQQSVPAVPTHEEPERLPSIFDPQGREPGFDQGEVDRLERQIRNGNGGLRVVAFLVLVSIGIGLAGVA